MSYRLTDSWRDHQLNNIHAYKNNTKYSLELVTAESIAKAWFIMKLNEYGINFAVYNLGGGVTKITTDATICPKCKGTGRIK